MAQEVLISLGRLLLNELITPSYETGKPIEHAYNCVSWLKIDLEFVDLKEIEDVIVDARRIVHDAGKFFKSCIFLQYNFDQKQRFLSDMIERYCRMRANYQQNNNNIIDWDHMLSVRDHRLSVMLSVFEGSEEYDETRGSIFGHHLSDWMQGHQGSITTSSGGQVVGVAEDVDCFVGLDAQVDLLLPHLVNEGGASGAYRFISLWGMGGLGKTAIAKAIYNHSDVRRHFSHFSWVSMPNDRSDGDTLHGILDDLLPGWQRSAELQFNTSKKILAEEDQKRKLWLLDTRFKKLLQNEKCLIVLDDIMSPDVLGVLHKAMSEGETTHSRIVLTTRNVKIAPCHQSPQCLIYVPQFLNDDQSWELLQKTAIRKQGT
ncbi:hypothetical protein LguiA_002296 [Lonicera macranthoides]